MTQKKLTKQQMRLAIAKDVIASLNGGWFTPSSGTYGAVSAPTPGSDESAPGWRNFSSALNATGAVDADDGRAVLVSLIAEATRCEACACGALFISALDLFDDVTVGQLRAEGSWMAAPRSRFLQRFFTYEELKTIEVCFEAWNRHEDGVPCLNSTELALICVLTQERRLRIIMQSIITKRGKVDGEHMKEQLVAAGEQVGRDVHPAERTPEYQQALVDAWNDKFPLDTRVAYWKGVRDPDTSPSGDGMTRTKAYLLGGHTACIFVTTEASCIALSHVQPLDILEDDK